ncbi:MAG: hypothetical protein JNL32_04210 [Candidatus Kapabacteria bacterium]|nr:hypothetical protein [Candidatus Kapabacteria bacterium]
MKAFIVSCLTLVGLIISSQNSYAVEATVTIKDVRTVVVGLPCDTFTAGNCTMSYKVDLPIVLNPNTGQNDVVISYDPASGRNYILATLVREDDDIQSDGTVDQTFNNFSSMSVIHFPSATLTILNVGNFSSQTVSVNNEPFNSTTYQFKIWL